MRFPPALVLILAVRAAAQEAPPAPCQGRPIVEVVLDGCEGVWCADPKESAKLISLSDFAVAAPWDAQGAKNAQKRLFDTGFFHHVDVSCALTSGGDGARVFVRLQPNRWIRTLDIKGHKALFESDLQKRLILGRGMAFNPAQADGQALRRRQKESIERLYTKEGFAETDVTVTSTPVEPDGEDVTIHVREGSKVKVGAIDVRFTKEPPRDPRPPFGPHVTCADVTARQVRRAADLSAGDAFTNRQDREATARVKRMLRKSQAGFRGQTIGMWMMLSNSAFASVVAYGPFAGNRTSAKSSSAPRAASTTSSSAKWRGRRSRRASTCLPKSPTASG